MNNTEDYNLGLAAASGNITLVLECLNKRNIDLNKPYNGMTPLCLAAFWGNSEIVEILLRKGLYTANVNAQSPQTLWTPCHCAAFQGHGKVLLKLMEYEPDLTITDKENRTAIDFGSAIDNIWPFFAAVGCKRTQKSILIAKKIIYKLDSFNADNSTYVSRPGSSYGIREVDFAESDRPSQKMYKENNMLNLTINEESDDKQTNLNKPNNTTPIFSIWQ